MSNKIISIDSSTTKTGYAVFENDELTEYDLINWQKIKIPEVRMEFMVKSIYEILDRNSPNTVVAELTAVDRNVKTQRMLTLVLGTLLGWCVAHNVEFVTYRPSQWRSYILKGDKPNEREGLKSWAIQEVAEIFNIKESRDDVAEAILIGLGHIKHTGGDIDD